MFGTGETADSIRVALNAGRGARRLCLEFQVKRTPRRSLDDELHGRVTLGSESLTGKGFVEQGTVFGLE